MQLYRKPKFYISKIAYLAFVGALLGISFSAVSTIWAPYIEGFVEKAFLVGLVTTLLAAISFLSSFIVIPILEKTNKAKVYFYSLVVILLSYVLFSLIQNFFLFLIVAIVEVIAIVFKFGSFGVMIRNESKLKDIGKSEGLRYTLLNIGYIAGPPLAGFIAAKFGIALVFVFASIVCLVTLFLFSRINIRESTSLTKSDYNLLKNIVSYFSDSARLRAYLLKGGMAVWWGVVYVFFPLLILQKGLGIEWVGIALFGVNLPLLLLEYPITKIADKKGFKIFFVFGFLILAFVSLLVFFSSSIYLIMVLFVISSVGAAFIEPLAEAYFFKITPKTEENKYYAPFLTSLDAGHVVGRAITSIVIASVAFNYLFLFLCFEMLFFVFISLTLKKK